MSTAGVWPLLLTLGNLHKRPLILSSSGLDSWGTKNSFAPFPRWGTYSLTCPASPRKPGQAALAPMKPSLLLWSLSAFFLPSGFLLPSPSVEEGRWFRTLLQLSCQETNTKYVCGQFLLFFPSQCCSCSDVSQVTLSPLLCRARIFGSAITSVVPTSVLWLLLEPTVRALPIQSSYCLPAGFPYHSPAQVTPQLTSVREPSHPTALMGRDFPLVFPPIPIPPS